MFFDQQYIYYLRNIRLCHGDTATELRITVKEPSVQMLAMLAERVGIMFSPTAVKALGDKIGIRRYGFFFLPMDESLARVVVDVGGRPHLVYEANAPTMFVRDFNIILVKEFCRAFSNALGANLHVQLVYGEEPHHVAEAIFKCLARALDMATQIEPRAADQLPSTKGKI